MIRRVLTLTLFALAACQQPAKSCTDDAECGAGARCVEQLCVVSTGGSGGGSAGGSSGGRAGGVAGGGTGGGTAGGTAGGATGGGATGGGIVGGGTAGGATGGGMTGGGMTGGGTGGGRPPLCNGGCTDVWATCIDDGDAGLCVPGRLVVTEPVNNATYAAGVQVPLLATLLIPDGGAPWPTPVSIPFAATWGLFGNVDSGVATSVAGRSDAGPGVVWFGWDAGPSNAQQLVSFTSCNSVACQPWQECVPTVTGGQCFDLPLTVSVTSPANDGLYTKQSGLVLQVRVQSADGGQLPSAVPVTGPGVMTTLVPRDALAGDTYSVQVNFSGEGPKTYVAGWDAGVRLSATRRLVYDVTPPMVMVNVLPRPTTVDADPDGGNPWKKDEEALVAVTLTDQYSPVEPMTATMVRAPGDGGVGGVTLAPAQCTGCTTGPGDSLTSCTCFRVDLARAPAIGARGLATVSVVGAKDRPENASALQASAPFGVTRFKWARDISLLAGSTRIQPVAVSRSGVVIASAEETPANTPRVLAYSPDGGLLWGAVTSGTVTAGPLLAAGSFGTGDVWVATQSGNSQLQRLALGNGMPVAAECIAATSTFTGDLALSSINGGATEIPLGVRNGFVQGPSSSGVCPPQELAGAADTNARPSLVVQTTSGLTEMFATYDGDTQFWKAHLTGTTWTPQGVANLPSGTQPRGLFYDGAGRAGGGGGVVGNGALFATSASALLSASTSFTSIAAANAGPPALGSGFLLYGTSSGQVVKVGYNPATGAMSAGLGVTGGVGNLQATSPVLGTGGLAYLVGVTGTLTVRRVSDLSEAWNASLATLSGSGVVSQPALDVYRTALGTKDCSKPLGVLYVLTKSGATATLRAILVDSQGLDSAAPWPKYQRDNSNTGNASLPLDPWVCP